MNLTSNQPFTEDEVARRFALVESLGVEEIDIWRMGLPDFWFNHISGFLNG
jgi:hypothetical protein